MQSIVLNLAVILLSTLLFAILIPIASILWVFAGGPAAVSHSGYEYHQPYRDHPLNY